MKLEYTNGRNGLGPSHEEPRSLQEVKPNEQKEPHSYWLEMRLIIRDRTSWYSWHFGVRITREE